MLGSGCLSALLRSGLWLVVCACGCGLPLYLTCLGWGLRRVHLGAGCGVGGGYEGRGVAPVLPFLAGACLPVGVAFGSFVLWPTGGHCCLFRLRSP